MNINSSKFNLSFQKKLMANANVIKDNEHCPVSIYKLQRIKDKDYFEKLQENDLWQKSSFLNKFSIEFKKSPYLQIIKGYDLDFYALEDKENNCLGLVEVDSGQSGRQKVRFIETFPANRSQKDFKYIGETMLAFLTKQIQSGKAFQQLYIPQATINAQSYYRKLGFLYDAEPDFPTNMCLTYDREHILLDSNKIHTGSEIELVG